MQNLDYKKFEGKFWKPENNVQYLVELANPRIEEKEFSDSKVKKAVAVFDVISVQKDNADSLPDSPIIYSPPKEFSTRNITFLDSVKPIIDNAIKQGRESIIIILRRTGEGKESRYSINDAGFIQKYRNQTV